MEKRTAIIEGASISQMLESGTYSEAIVKSKQGVIAGYDLGWLLDKKMASGAKIILKGCNTADAEEATGKVPVAQVISQSVPSAQIQAYNGRYFLFGRTCRIKGIPLSSTVVYEGGRVIK
jgi:hypothetical protein